jgi:hypothetical protein
MVPELNDALHAPVPAFDHQGLLAEHARYGRRRHLKLPNKNAAKKTEEFAVRSVCRMKTRRREGDVRIISVEWTFSCRRERSESPAYDARLRWPT